MLRAQFHHSHFLPSLFPSFESKPNILSFFFFFFSFSLIFFFFGLWIQLQVTHLALSSSFGLKYRLFMNFVRLVHILCSIWPYENGLIKQFKHKDQCPICNASPMYFGIYFLFFILWKTYLNLYLKWAMIFRSPHLFFPFLFLLDFFLKRWSNFVSTHQSLLLVPLQSLSWMFTLSAHEGLALSFKSFFVSFQMGLALSSKVQTYFFFLNSQWALSLVQRVWSIGSKIFHLLILIGLLVSLPMSLGFRASKLSQSMDGFDIFSIKPITYSWP